MKKINLILLLVITIKLSAQNNLIGIIAGADMTNIFYTANYAKTTYIKGFTGGLTYEHLFKNHLSLGADVIYNQRGYSSKLSYRSGIDIIGDGTITDTYYYLSVPIKAGFNCGKKAYYFGNIGVIPSYLVNATSQSPHINSSYAVEGTDNTNITNIVTKFDLAGIIEAGAGYKFKERYWLYVQYSFQRSFTNVSNSEYFGTGSTIKNFGMSFCLGFKYNLTKI